MLGFWVSVAWGVPIASVVGGEEAPVGAWPDATAVANGWEVTCTGTLIAPDLVLTAGHCAEDLEYVVVGADDYEGGGEQIGIDAVHEYPNSWVTYDVAVLELSAPAAALPRTLALDCLADDNLYDGAAVAIVGFGRTNSQGTETTTHLMEAFTTVRDADCSDLDRGCNAAVSPGGELIAGGDGVDSCTGDSGGPLYLAVPGGWALIGVTSRASAPADVPCGDGGIYVRADAVVDWIEAETGRVLPRPDCPGNQPPRPSADALLTQVGETVSGRVSANDPDAGDAHTYVVTAPPAGSVEFAADGSFAYTAPDVPGVDAFTVTVTDDAEPPASAGLVVSITVEPDSAAPDTDEEPEVGACGCHESQFPAGLAPLALILGRRRRFQRPDPANTRCGSTTGSGP